jgi:valyl-tRNA synthetase
MASVRSIDPSGLPKHFDAAAAELRWDAEWEKSGVYRWDPSRPREETFVVDTPPPTASGELHVGHVFSYTHTDVVVRFQRMRGKNIFYPIGWDDNGVPTERRVQNLFHVRCDPTLPRDPTLELEPATAKIRKGRHRVISRSDFIDLCARVTAEDEKAFLQMWRRVGLSVD